jgi:hypothetical protein
LEFVNGMLEGAEVTSGFTKPATSGIRGLQGYGDAADMGEQADDSGEQADIGDWCET